LGLGSPLSRFSSSWERMSATAYLGDKVGM
jgi:hypothetical protein